MRRRDFDRLLERDGGKCMHCGTTEGLIPQHRKNRGMGGSKLRDVPSNLIVLCSFFNDLIEIDATAASVAIAYGWKVEGLDAWELIPVYDVTAQGWFVLDNHFNRLAVSSGEHL
jgi:hypothetical protein